MMAGGQTVNRVRRLGYLTAENVTYANPSFDSAAAARLDPRRVSEKDPPHALALGERFPGEQIMEVVVAVADQHGPESGLPDAVLVPELEGVILETLEQRR